MALTQRERKIAIGLGAALGAYLLWAYPVSGYISARGEAKDKIAENQAKLDEADILAARREKLENTTLPFLVQAGLADPSLADSMLSHMLSSYSKDTGLTISASRSDQSSGVGAASNSAAAKSGFKEVKAQVTAKGTQAGLTWLFWRLETTQVPIRIGELSVTVPKEGQDILNVQLGISTLALPPEGLAQDNPGKKP